MYNVCDGTFVIQFIVLWHCTTLLWSLSKDNIFEKVDDFLPKRNGRDMIISNLFELFCWELIVLPISLDMTIGNETCNVVYDSLCILFISWWIILLSLKLCTSYLICTISMLT